MLLLGVAIFLHELPSTGFDYDHYKQAFDSSYANLQFPWFHTENTMTSEPLYLWYSSFLKNILPIDFKSYLVVNFLICIAIASKALRHFPLENKVLFLLMMLPVIIPTIFYFSPRSSVSFFLILLGTFLLFEKKLWLSLIFFFLGLSIHSQYILISFVILTSYGLLSLIKKHKSLKKHLLLLYMILLSIIIIKINTVLPFVSSILSFLPSADVAASKLHYLKSAREGFRVTGLLSIAFFPIILLLIYPRKSKLAYFTKEYREIFLNISSTIVFTGALINIIFINAPHVAGRISRFSDYYSLTVLLPIFLLLYFKGKHGYFFPIFLIIVSPIVYDTIYNF